MSDGSVGGQMAASQDMVAPVARPTCLLAVPHNGAMVPEALGTLAAAGKTVDVSVIQAGSSLLCHNFNKAWCDALNANPRPDYFAMVHSDISAPEGWLDVLLDEMHTAGADFCSAVVPIKDFRGLTSTALMNAGDGTLRRLTVKELAAVGEDGKRLLPVTFTGDELRRKFGLADDANVALCVNSGLWVCKFGPWATEVCFETGDRISREPDPTHPRGEVFVARVFSEDWLFSSQLIAKGLRVVATSRVPVTHYGRAPFGCGGDKTGTWGMDHDEWVGL